MAFSRDGLRIAFEAQGEAGFAAWTYATHDMLEQVLEPGYFNASRRFAPGDLLFLGTEPVPADRRHGTLPPNQETHRALLMVQGVDAAGQMRVRLVQDLGRAEDPVAPSAARRRMPARSAKEAAAA